VALLLPIVFVLIEICAPEAKGLLKRLRRTVPSLLIMAVVSCVTFYITRYSANRMPEVYRMVFTGAVFTQGLGYYLSDLLNSSSASGIEVMTYVAVFVALLLLAVGFRRRLVFFGGVGFLAPLLPVIFIPGLRAPFYLYLPSVFFSVFVVATVAEIVGLLGYVSPWIKQRLPALRIVAAAAVAVTLVVGGMDYRSGQIAFTANLARMNRSAVEFLQSRHLAPGATIALRGVPEYANMLSYNDGQAVKVVRKDSSIKIIPSWDSKSVLPKDTVFITYKDGVYKEGLN